MRKFTTIAFITIFIFGLNSCVRNSNSTGINGTPANSYFSSLPLRFIENVGQALPEVQYHVEGAGHTVLFKSDRIVFKRSNGPHSSLNSNEISMEFVGSNSDISVKGLRKQKGHTNFYSGSNPADWYTGIPSFKGLKYEELYPGINMVYLGDEGSLKNEFHLSAGANPEQILIAYQGIQKLKVNKKGDLIISTVNGTLVDAAPVAYQLVEGKSKEVKVRYRLQKKKVGFKLGNYNPELPLVIDPVFSYVTYYGGNDYTLGAGVAEDSDGYLLFAGHSLASNLSLNKPAQESNAGLMDAFVVKMDTASGEYIYATYLGGTADDYVHDFATDQEGNAYIAGHTTSSDFPASENAYQTSPNGLDEVFLAKFKPDGTLVFSTYLGGTYSEHAYGLTMNQDQEVFLTGLTQSMDFPLKNALQPAINGALDVFVSKISTDGSTLLYSTYLGGTENDIGQSIALDENENIFITGETASTDYPLANAAQETKGGLTDAFVSKLETDGQSLVFSTFLGGEEADIGFDILIDTNGVAFVCGGTESEDFPMKNFGPAESLKSLKANPETNLYADPSGFPMKNFGRSTYTKSARDASDAEADAFVAFFDVLGFLIFSDPRSLDGYDYFTTMVILSTAYNRILAATGYNPFGVSVIMYAIHNYMERVEELKGESLFYHHDGSYYYSKGIAASKSGNIILNMATTATLQSNGDPDPNPGYPDYDDNLLAYPPQAKLKVTISMPEKIKPDTEFSAKIIIENTSTDVEAKFVKVKLLLYSARIRYDIIEPDPCLSPFKDCYIGSLPPGGSVEKTIRFKVDEPLDVGDLFEVSARAYGINADAASDEESAKIIFPEAIMDFVYHALGFRLKKSTLLEMIDVYVNDSLVADDLKNGIKQEHSLDLTSDYPKIDITDGNTNHNQDPIATYEIDLTGSGIGDTITPKNHQLILIEDSEMMIHLHHKRDVQATSSDPSVVDLYIIHGASELGEIDIRLVEENNYASVLETIFDDIAPDSVTDYVSLTPGIHYIEVSSADNGIVYDVAGVDLSGLAGNADFGVVIPVAGNDQVLSASLLLSAPVVQTGIGDTQDGIRKNRAELSSYPNPFSSSVSMAYDLSKSANTEISIYNSSGQKIRTLLNAYQPEGKHTIEWNGKDEAGIEVDPGIYIGILITDNTTISRKMTKTR